MEIGIDIIDTSTLSKTKIKRLVSHFLSDIETSEKASTLSLIGKIAAKEAIVKTGAIRPGEWKKVRIINDKNGKPLIYDDSLNKFDDIRLSISHSNNTVVAVAIYIPENE